MARSVQVARLFMDLEMNTKGLDRELTSAEKSFGRTATFIAKHPVAALGALGTATVAVGIKAAGMAAQFEHSLAEVATQVDTTAVSMEDFRTGILDLFRSMPINTVDELTKGLYEIISAGIPAGDALDFLRVSAEAAVGGVTSVDVAVDGLTTAVNAFATQGLTAQEAADKFFVAVKLGKTTFGEVASSIGNTAALANTLGISLDDLLANMTALTLNGISTSEAFNAIRGVLSNVIKPTQEFRDLLPGMAERFNVAALQSKGLTGFLTELAGELKGNTTAASTMFGRVEALNAVLALTADGGVRVNGILGEMSGAAGATGAAYQKMAQTTESVNKILKNELSANMLEFGNSVLPIVNRGLRISIELLDALSNTAARMRADTAINSIKNLTTVIGKLNGEAQADALKNLMQEFANVGGVEGAGKLGKALRKLGDEDLEVFRKGLVAAINTGQLTERQLKAIRGGINEIANIIVERGGLKLRPVVEKADVDAVDQLIAKVRDVGKASVEERLALKAALTELATSGTLTTEQLEKVRVAIRQVGATLSGGDGSLDDAAKKAFDKIRKEHLGGVIKGFEDWGAAVQRVERIVADATVTLVDDLELALDDLAADFREAGLSAEQTAKGLKPLQDQLKLLKVTEKLKLPEILEKSAKALTQFDVKRLQAARAELLKISTQVTAGEETHKKVLEDIKEVEDKILDQTAARLEKQIKIIQKAEEEKRKLNDVANAAKGVTDETDKTRQKVLEITSRVVSIAQGALGAAQAFGILKGETAAVLQNIIATGENIAKFAASGFTDPTALIGAVGSLAGVISGLFGESPVAKAREALLKSNTEALDRLNRTTGDLVALQEPGAKLFSAEQAIESALAKQAASPAESLERLLPPELLKVGLTLKELEQLASDLGIAIRNPESGRLEGDAIRQLLEALRGLDTAIGQDFASQLQNIQDLIKIGVIDPRAEFAEIVELLGSQGATAITNALKDIDIFRGVSPERAAELQGLEEILAGLEATLSREQGDALVRLDEIAKALAKPGLSDAERQRLEDERARIQENAANQKKEREEQIKTVAEQIAGLKEIIASETAAGRQEAIESLRDLFLRLTRGEVTTEELGGLSRSEFSDIIQTLIGLLEGEGALLPGEVGGPTKEREDEDTVNFSRTADAAEAQAGSMEELLAASEAASAEQSTLLSEQVGHLSSIEELTAQVVARLEDLAGAPRLGPVGIGARPSDALESLLSSIGSFQPVQPPSLPASILAPQTAQPVVQGASVSIGSIEVVVQGSLNGDPAESGRIAGIAAAEELNRMLGDDFHLHQLRAGQLTGGIIRR